MGTHQELLSAIERLANRICGRPTLVGVLVAAAVWMMANGLNEAAVDPFPFVWLQRVSIAVNVPLVVLALWARSRRAARRASPDRTPGARGRAPEERLPQFRDQGAGAYKALTTQRRARALTFSEGGPAYL